MKGVGAYRGDANLKDALLADISEIGPITESWISRALDTQQCAAIAHEHGFTPAFVYFVNAMAGDPRDTDVQLFLTGLIEAINPGACTIDILRRWFLWSWEEASPSLQAQLNDSDAFAPAQAIVEQVRASLCQEVSAEAWRIARAELSKAKSLSPDQTDAAEIVLSMSWDLCSVPGSAKDVVEAWQAALRRWGLRANGWTDEMEQELIDFGYAIHDRAMAELGEPTEENKEEFLASYKTLTQTLRTESDMQAKISHNNEARHLANEKRWAWRDTAREAAILCASLEPATT